MSLRATLQTFKNELNRLERISDLPYNADANGNLPMAQDEALFIAKSCFLEVFIAWESFLEDSFVKYLRGKYSSLQTRPKRFAQPVDDAHANKMIIGNNRFADWSNPETVKKLASIYFRDGEPYRTSLNSIADDLNQMKTIRNSCAHSSATTQQKLDALATRIISGVNNDIHVGDLLTSPHLADTSVTVAEYFKRALEISAENIAKNTI
ncbi:MAG: hypothetical protein ACI9SP_003128 [Arenicella sp.]|jgi:hypothetical protein